MKHEISPKMRTAFLLSVIMVIALLPISGSDLASARAQEAQTDSTESATPTVTDLPILDIDPDIEPQGANCSSPVAYDDQWSNGFRLVCQNNFYVLMVDLTNPAIRVEVMAASSGTHPLSYYTDSNTIAVINADYQWPCPAGRPCSQGLTISRGSGLTQYTDVEHLCTDAWVRREIGFSQDSRPVIDWWYKFVSDGQARSWCSPWHAEGIPNGDSGGGKEGYSYDLVGAGPQFTFDSAFRWQCGDGTQNHDCPGPDVVINGEHFGTGSWWSNYQSAMGYTTDGTVLALGESNNRTHTMQDVHDLMYQRLSAYGKTLQNAFRFDGGSKAGFWYYNHTYDSTPGVYVPSVIRVQRTNSTCYSLSTNVNPGGSGNVSVNTPSNCAQGKYTPGTNVELSASPNSGYTFSNWSGDASGTSSNTTVVMNSNKSVTANFTQGCTPASVPPRPSSISPPDGSMSNTTTPTLDWADAPATSCVDYYHIQIYEDGGGQVDIAWPAVSTYTVPSANLTLGKKYWWYVWAHNSLGFGEASLQSFWAGTPATMTTNYRSIATDDGWILESTETSSQGGTRNATATTFRLGDDASDRQYRSILSFNTAGLPDGAVITKVTLKIKRYSTAGTNPFTTHGNLLVDVRTGKFYGNAALQLADFKATANLNNAGYIPRPPVNGWYTRTWTSRILAYINKTGLTQLRLRFAVDDNDDRGADYLNLYSGNATTSYRPQLIITYYVP